MRAAALSLSPITIVTGKRQLKGWSILLRFGSREWELGAVHQTGATR